MFVFFFFSGVVWMFGGLFRVGRVLEFIIFILNLLIFFIVYTGKTGVRLRSYFVFRCGFFLILGVNVYGMLWFRMLDVG